MIRFAQIKYIDNQNCVLHSHGCHLYCIKYKDSKKGLISHKFCQYLTGEVYKENEFEYKVNCKNETNRKN